MSYSPLKTVKAPVHLRLTYKDWTENFSSLTRAELGVLYCIRTLDPWGDKEIELDCGTIAKDLGLHRTSVSRALEQLSTKGFITLLIEKARIRQRVTNKLLTLLKTEQEGDFGSCASTHTSCTDAQEFAPTHADARPCTDSCADAQEFAPTHNGIYIDHAHDHTTQTLQTDQTLHTSPLPPQGEQEEGEEVTGCGEIGYKIPETPIELVAVSQISANSIVKATPASPDQNSAPRRRNFNNEPSTKPTRYWLDDVPDGPWFTEKRLLKRDFTEWMAQRWMNKFGKKSLIDALEDVNAHFRKDPVNHIPDAWSLYHQEMSHRAAVVVVHEQSGVEVDEEYKQGLFRQAEAIATPAPAELSAIEYRPAKAVREYVPEMAQKLQSVSGGIRQIAAAPPEGAENPNAYKPYQAPQLPQEEAKSNFSQLAQMVKSVAGRKGMQPAAKPPEPPKDKLAQMQEWARSGDAVWQSEIRAWVAAQPDVIAMKDDSGFIYDLERIDF